MKFSVTLMLTSFLLFSQASASENTETELRSTIKEMISDFSTDDKDLVVRAFKDHVFPEEVEEKNDQLHKLAEQFIRDSQTDFLRALKETEKLSPKRASDEMSWTFVLPNTDDFRGTPKQITFIYDQEDERFYVKN